MTNKSAMEYSAFLATVNQRKYLGFLAKEPANRPKKEAPSQAASSSAPPSVSKPPTRQPPRSGPINVPPPTVNRFPPSYTSPYVAPKPAPNQPPLVDFMAPRLQFLRNALKNSAVGRLMSDRAIDARLALVGASCAADVSPLTVVIAREAEGPFRAQLSMDDGSSLAAEYWAAVQQDGYDLVRVEGEGTTAFDSIKHGAAILKLACDKALAQADQGVFDPGLLDAAFFFLHVTTVNSCALLDGAPSNLSSILQRTQGPMLNAIVAAIPPLCRLLNCGLLDLSAAPLSTESRSRIAASICCATALLELWRRFLKMPVQDFFQPTDYISLCHMRRGGANLFVQAVIYLSNHQAEAAPFIGREYFDTSSALYRSVNTVMTSPQYVYGLIGMIYLQSPYISDSITSSCIPRLTGPSLSPLSLSASSSVSFIFHHLFTSAFKALASGALESTVLYLTDALIYVPAPLSFEFLPSALRDVLLDKRLLDYFWTLWSASPPSMMNLLFLYYSDPYLEFHAQKYLLPRFKALKLPKPKPKSPPSLLPALFQADIVASGNLTLHDRIVTLFFCMENNYLLSLEIRESEDIRALFLSLYQVRVFLKSIQSKVDEALAANPSLKELGKIAHTIGGIVISPYADAISVNLLSLVKPHQAFGPYLLTLAYDCCRDIQRVVNKGLRMLARVKRDAVRRKDQKAIKEVDFSIQTATFTQLRAVRKLKKKLDEFRTKNKFFLSP